MEEQSLSKREVVGSTSNGFVTLVEIEMYIAWNWINLIDISNSMTNNNKNCYIKLFIFLQVESSQWLGTRGISFINYFYAKTNFYYFL